MATEPTVERRRRGTRVDGPDRNDSVFLPIQQDVPQNGMHLPCAEEIASVIAIAKHLSLLAPEERVDAQCRPNAEATHAGGKGPAIHGLDDEVHVVVLHGVVHDLKAFDLGHEEDRSKRVEGALISKQAGASHE
jgi:hypothetical protein